MRHKNEITEEAQFETELLNALEHNNLKSIADVDQEIARTTAIFKASAAKSKRVNIRLTEKDYQQVQIKAMEEGLPYQSLLASILHKWLTGRLVEKQA